METNSYKGTALITGASSGIGAIYADRLARRGHDLILVARNRERLEALARRLTHATGRSVEVIPADLNNDADLARIESKLRTDSRISLLVNNAGFGAITSLLESNVERMDEMLALNVRALMRLTYAAVPGLVPRHAGTIINIASIVAISPERDFVHSLAHRIGKFPAAGLATIKERTNTIALAPVEDFRHDSALFGQGASKPEATRRFQAAMKHGFQTREAEMDLAGLQARCRTIDQGRVPCLENV